MRFFSGFGLQNEKELFDFWISGSEVEVAGFSYGAIKALEYLLSYPKRVDRLILLSPAFFNNKDERFKRLQILAFSKDKKSYMDRFFKNISSGIDMKQYYKEPTKEELQELLYYRWERDKIEELKRRGVEVEVILGEKDKIIDSKEALNFFKDIATTYYIKGANHILKEVK